MKRIILFIITGVHLCAYEVRDNIGIFDESSKKEFEKEILKIEKKSGINFIFEYDFSKKIINLKDNRKTILLEIVKKDNRKTDVNLYVSSDLNLNEELLKKAVWEKRDLIENGKYKEYSYQTARKLGENNKKNSLFLYFFSIISFIFLLFIVKYVYKGFRANRFRKEEESPDFTEQGGS